MRPTPMRRSPAVLLIVVMAATCLTSCNGPPPTRPLTADESQALERQLEAVDAFERRGGRDEGGG